MWVSEATTGMRRSELTGAERFRLDRAKKLLQVRETRAVVTGEAVDSDTIYTDKTTGHGCELAAVGGALRDALGQAA
jgi:hypothetical protein